MASMGVLGPSSGLHQFLASLATSGTTPSRPVGVSVPGAVPAADPDSSSPNGTTGSALAQTPPQQLASLIQTTMNTLNSSKTGNPLDALQSIESSPGLEGLLGQLNVNPQQFRSDVLAAITQSPNGIANSSQVFQSFPAGQSLNALA